MCLAEEDLLISTEQTAGYYAVSEYDRTVALDTAITPELKEEGFLREVVSKLQTMRKEGGMEVTDPDPRDLCGRRLRRRRAG